MRHKHICKIKDCGRDCSSHGFCGKHYDWYKKGCIDIEGNILRKVMQYGVNKCKVSGCDRTYASTGFCEYHRSQFRRGIIDKNGNMIRKLKMTYHSNMKCDVEGCSKNRVGTNFCPAHYYHYRKGCIDEKGKELKYYKENIGGKKYDRNVEFLRDRYFEGKEFKCETCGEVFEFYMIDGHHTKRDIKTFELARIIESSEFSESPQLYAELDSLKWLCSHCHIVEHYGEDTPYEQTRKSKKVGILMDKRISEILKITGHECKICKRNLGRRTVVFHHREASEKYKCVSQLLGIRKLSFILEEVKKCDILCNNCHRRYHQDHIDSKYSYDRVRRLEVYNKCQEKTIFDRRCCLEGCNDMHFGLGFCRLHYERFKHGIINEKGEQLRCFERKCLIEGCGKKHESMGFCRSHYVRFKKGIIDKNGNQLRPLFKNGLCRIKYLQDKISSVLGSQLEFNLS